MRADRGQGARTELEGNTVRLSGGVEVTQGYREFTSDEASINRETRAGSWRATSMCASPACCCAASAANFTSRSGEAQLENSRFVLHEQHLRGSAALLSARPTS
jgi:LPS-assembly protein